MKKRKCKTKKMAYGSDLSGLEGMGSGIGQAAEGMGVAGGGAYGALLDGAIGIIDTLSNPPQYQKQPIVNAKTMNTMVSPYAFGGEILPELEEAAENAGMSVEDFIAYLQDQDDSEDYDQEDMLFPEEDPLTEDVGEDEDSEEEYAFGGSIITDGDDKSKKLRKKLSNNNLSTQYNRYSGIVNEGGKTVENPSTLESINTMVNYMQNNWWDQSNTYRPEFQHHSVVDDIILKPQTTAAYGGVVKKKVEVEGKEALQTPDGAVTKVEGPSHEEGGVDIIAPEGTKVYSDRLKIDGKTFAQRKITRSNRLNRVQRSVTSVTDVVGKNTLKRTKEANDIEEANDMAIQKLANYLMTPPTQDGGKAAYGDDGDPEDPFNIRGIVGGYYTEGLQLPATIPYSPGYAPANKIPMRSTPQVRNTVTGAPANAKGIIGNAERKAEYSADIKNPELDAQSFSVGDYVGMAGNLINTVAPIVNTIKNAKAGKPNVNRFKSFGKTALDTNRASQTFAAGELEDALTDIDTSANSSVVRNNNSASSVNTARALNIATDINKSNAQRGVRRDFSKLMTGLLGQEANLENERDRVVMTGETQRDAEDKADLDNFYSNMAQNLVNAGTNIQGLGRNMNTSATNKASLNLLANKSKNNIGVTKSGNVVNKYLTKTQIDRYLAKGWTINEDGELVPPKRKIKFN